MVRRQTVFAALGAATACVVVAGAIVAGLRVPARATLAPMRDESLFDYDATFRSGFAPLRAEYVRHVLGGEAARDLARSGARPARDSGVGADDPFGGPPRTELAHPFTNDSISHPQEIAGVPFTARTDATSATRESADPAECGATGGTAWYRYRSGRDEDLTANTFGSGYALRLGVFERTQGGNLRLLGCDADVEGNALVQFHASRGSSYLFEIAAQATGGSLVFNLDPPGITRAVWEEHSDVPLPQGAPAISANGRLVAFWSYAPDVTSDSPGGRCAQARPPSGLEDASWNIDPVFPCSQAYVADRVTGHIRLVSMSSSGEVANGQSIGLALSGNGRFVAFVSHATNLVPGDTNGVADVFVRDLRTRQTERVSLTWDGRQLTGGDPTGRQAAVSAVSLSDDGRFVAFESTAANLVADDSNGIPDVFVRDRLLRRTDRVSISSTEEQAVLDPAVAPGYAVDYERGGYLGLVPVISGDGRFVVFVSRLSSNLVDGDTNGVGDLFLRDLQRGTTEIVSLSSSGEQGNDAVAGQRPSLSGDGRYVAFASYASNLVAGDSNGETDVFVRDRLLRKTARASESSSGRQSDGSSLDAAISRDGRTVMFVSTATTLAPGSRSSPANTFGPAELPATAVFDLYAHDLATSTTVRIGVAPSGEQLDGTVQLPSVSADGGIVAFNVIGRDGLKGAIWVHERPRRRP
jgi:Tol biopolymer transport system component